MTVPLVCVVGSINEDTTLRVHTLPHAGETVLATGVSRAQGGKGGNQAAAAAAVGGRVAFVGAVGADPPGAEALESLRSRGVDVTHVVQTSAAPTGTATVLVDDAGENLIVVNSGANLEVDAAQAAAAVSALVPAITLGQLEIPVAALLAAARATTSGRFILNPAPMPDDPGALSELLPLTHVLTPNRSELGRLAGHDIPRTLAEVDECVERLDFGGAVVVTLGSEGAALYDQGTRRAVSPVEVTALDTSGAGDVFCGVLAYRLAAGAPLIEAVHHANQAAAISTTRHGAQVPSDFRG